jgi:phospholipid/cholesterol/gamma-HCH transport system substrate-binding protein
MQKAGLSVGRIVVISGFALSCFGLLLFLWLAFGGPVPLKPRGYQVQVTFPDAATLADQADVRIAGVDVGKVVARRRAASANATVATIEFDERYAPLRSDARAMLRLKTLLGETYVELTPGTRGAPFVPDGGRLPDGQVRDQVDFDELLRTFDPRTRRSFQRWQSTLAAATHDRAEELSDALGTLPRFVDSGRDVVSMLRRRRAALGQLVRETGTTFAAISRDAGALRDLVVRNREVFDELASERESLAQAIRILPTFEVESRLTIERVSRFARDAEPLLRDLEPVLEDAVPTLASLRRLAPDLDDLFADLEPLIDAGRSGLPALGRVLRGLDPTLAAFGPFLQQVNPILEYLELNQATVSNFVDIGPSALGLKLPTGPANKSTGHALPQIIVTGRQSIPHPTRDPENRGNAYFAPNALNYDSYGAGFFVYPTWDCANAGGERRPDDEVPGCVVQGPIAFGAPPLRRFPHVAEAGAGGATFGRGDAERP